MDTIVPILDDVENLLADDLEVARFKRFLYIYGYDFKGEGEGSLHSLYMNEAMVSELKARLIKWVENHPDVWHEDTHRTPHMWFVLNAIGDIIGWKEDPWKWLPKRKQ